MQTIDAHFRARVCATPNAPALSDDTRNWSCVQLDQWVAGLAARLASAGVKPGDRVAVCLDRTPELVAAFLASLRVGATYVPLDPSYPEARLSFMLADVQATVMICQPEFVGRLADVPRLLFINAPSEGRFEGPEPTDPDALASIIYTSGSTGRPKGVGLTHRALVTLATNPELFTVRPGEGVAQCANASFDAWLQEVTACLLMGGRLEVISTHTLLSAPGLKEAIVARGISTMFLPTGLFNQLAAVGPSTFCGLHTLVIGGDVPDPRGVRAVLEVCPTTCIKNGYGPTECTVFATYFSMSDPEQVPSPVPIGRPLEQVEIWLLDDAGRPVPRGDRGELCIGGPGVAPGYWRSPDLTEARFLAHPERPNERIYKTGDIAWWDAQGYLHFGGRRDLQVKVRGYRVELGEIEAVLSACEGVRDRVVVAPRDPSGQRRLVAYFVPKDPPHPTVAQVNRHFETCLPEYMRPAATVRLKALPLTPNGKVDRDALPNPFGSRVAAIAPRTDEERLVAGLFETVLDLSGVSVHDDFFELGGHSLLVTQLLWRADELGRSVSAQDVYAARTVEALALRLASAPPPQAAEPEMVQLSRDGDLPLTFAQARLVFLARLDPLDATYNSSAIVRLRGPLDVGALQASLLDLVQRHEATRSTVVQSTDGAAARVHAAFVPELVIIERLELDATQREEVLLQLTLESAGRPFDLTKLPLTRWTLVRLGPEDHALLIVEQHIVHDGWSFNLLLTELFALYRSRQSGLPSRLEPTSFHISDIAAWQRAFMQTPAGQAQIAHYVRRLRHAPELELPIMRARPARASGRGRTPVLDLDKATVQRLRAVARAESTTLFALMLTAFEILLMRYSGQHDLVIGTSVANRRTRESERVLGMLVNNVVLRLDLSGEPSVRAALHRAHAELLSTLDNQDVPFEQVVEVLAPDRLSSKNPLFQIMFNMHGSPPPVIDVPGLEVSWQLPVPNGTAKTDLNVVTVPRYDGDGLADLRMHFEYATDLFATEDIDRFIRAYRYLLLELPDNLHRPVSSLELLDRPERRDRLRAGRGDEAALPKERTLPEHFTRVAARQPHAVALSWHDGTMTYAELDRASDRLARRLVAAGVQVGQHVTFLATRGPQMVVSMLAISKAGGAYVPIDPDFPAARIQQMFGIAEPSALVADHRPAWAPASLQRIHPIEGADPTQVDLPAIDANDRAYVMFTSGSTAEPRGVEVPHRAITRLLFGTEYVQLSPGRCILHHSPASFDASTFEVWGALLHGGRCVLAPAHSLTPQQLVDMVGRHQVDTLWVTASLFNAVVDDLPHGLTQVAQIITGGEALSVPHVQRALQLWPKARIVNGYGPTECTVFACCHVLQRPFAETTRVPIGRPIANTLAYVLDHHQRLLPPGVPGELYLGGPGLALGYLGRPELTAERFLPNPYGEGRLYRTGDRVRAQADGVLDFLGRTDRQVKLRGFRIELDEVEQALLRCPGVAAAVALVQRDARDEDRLLAFVQSRTGDAPTAGAVDAFLQSNLPSYMRPARITVLQQLPKTSSGKVDRAALLALGPSEVTQPVRRNAIHATELLITRLWSELLGVEDIGRNDNFFDLGGHSLLAARLVDEMERTLGQRLPLTAVLADATVAGMSRRLQENRQDTPLIVPIHGSGPQPPLFFLHGDFNGGGYYASRIAAQLPKSQPIYLVHPFGVFASEVPDTLGEMADQYLDAILAERPQGPYRLAGFCTGGLLAHDVARRLVDAGHVVDGLLVIDTYPQNVRLSRAYDLVTRRAGPRLDPWGTRARRALNLSERGRRGLHRLKSMSVAQRWSYLTQRFTRAAEPGPTSGAQEDLRAKALADRYRRLQAEHVPRPYPGAMTAIWPQIPSGPATGDPQKLWARLATSVDHHVTPGGHLSCLTEHCEALAQLIQRGLNIKSESAGLRPAPVRATPAAPDLHRG